MKPVLERLNLGPHRAISAFRHAKPHFETPWHFHPQHELTYIEESVGTKFIGDYVGPYGPGELVLLRSNLPHCWKNHAQSGQLAESTVIQWNTNSIAKVSELLTVFEMLKKASKGILFPKDEIHELVPAILKLPSLSGGLLYTELLQILIQLANCSQQTLSEASFLDDVPSKYNSRIAKIHEFVAGNYHRKIYLVELAQLTNLSEQSFARFFSKMMGRSFFVFLNEYRINMACRMLIDTDQSVAEIGFSSGYESPPFFHKQFIKFKGTTPGKYRKKYQ